MGFYGNITNTSKTQFQFDRIYSNRWEMDAQRSYDGIYAGRYVLVEYDQSAQLDNYIRVYNPATFTVKDNDNTVTYYVFHTSEDVSAETVLNKNDMIESLVFTATKVQNASQGYDYKNVKLFKYNENLTTPLSVNEKYRNAAVFELISDTATENIPTYTINYNIDTSIYGKGRGYDSTVWQKTYMDGIEKYIMVAELNTVVPTFDVSADAPTQRPLVPHFDTQSTDVYYKLHWQPAWGFRVKEANRITETAADGTTYQSSTDTADYLSDEIAVHQTYTFNPSTGLTDANEPTSYDAAIYYNKAGFDKKKRTYHEGKHEDSINIKPTGQSGNKYNIHDGTSDVAVKTDIQELQILLPSLGNTISDIWDLVYGKPEEERNSMVPIYNQQGTEIIGYEKEEDENGNEIKGFYRWRDVEWKDAVDIENNVHVNEEIGGMTRDLSTVAGCINSVHDLMGMIITDINEEYIQNTFYKEVSLDENTYERGKYWVIKDGEYILSDDLFYNTSVYYEYLETNGEDWFNKNYIYFNKNDNKYYRINKYNTYSPINEIFDFNETISYDNGEEEVHYTYRIGESGEAHIITRDTSDQTLTKYKEQIVEELINYLTQHKGYSGLLYQLLNVEDNNHQNVKTVINKKALINLSNEDFSNILYHTGYGYEYLEVPELAENLGTIHGCILQIKKLLEAEDSETRDTSTVTGAINQLNDLIGNFNDLMPGEFLIANKDGKISSAGWTTAQNYSYTNYKDLNPQTVNKTFNTKENRWISLSLNEENGEIELIHKINPIEDTVTIADKNNECEQNVPNLGLNFGAGDTLNLYTPIVDAMGHTVGRNTETITLPFGYKYITTNSYNSENDSADLYTNNGDDTTTSESTLVDKRNPTIVANNTQDTFSIDAYNKWIQIETTDDEVDRHEIHPINLVKKSDTDLNELTDAERNNPEIYDKDAITIQDTIYDVAGHIIENRLHKYTLPYGFKTITTNGRNDENLSVNTGEFSNDNIIADQTQDILNIDSGNKWIRMDTIPNEDRIIISHDIHDTSSTEETTDWTKTESLTVDNNEVDLSIPVTTYFYDKAGHYTNHHTENYKLPYGYGKITGDAGADTAATATYDELFFTGDQWLLSNIDKDTVQFTHEFNPVDSTTSELNKNDSTTGNTLELYTPIVDGTGHVVGQNIETVILPYGYKKIIVSNNSSVTDMNTNDGSVEADNIIDTLTIKAQNKWMHLAHNVNDDSISIAHEVNTISTSSEEIDWSTTELSSADIIIIPTSTYDEAGHITNYSVKNYKLPRSYGKIKGNNNTSTAATTTYDELEFTGDKWLSSAIGSDVVSYSHTNANPNNISTNDKITSNVTPAFGDTFTIKDPHFDERGHWFANTDHTIKIPTPSLTFGNTSGNVLSALSLESSSGTITGTLMNLSSLSLIGYSKDTSLDTTQDLSADYTLSQALYKLEAQIKNEASRINNLGTMANENKDNYVLKSDYDSLVARIKKLEEILLPEEENPETPEGN